MITPTERERQVLLLMWDGLSSKRIADTLCVSEKTVSNHITAIYNKLGVDDRVTACRTAIERGWIPATVHDHKFKHVCDTCGFELLPTDARPIRLLR